MLLRPTTPPLWLGVVVAASFIVTESLVLLALKHLVHGNAFGVAFLVGVLVVSTVWGFGLAVMTSLASAVAFDYFRNWPGDFMPANAENWVTIGVFLVVALVTNTVAYLARSRAVEAERRRLEAEASRDELRRLAQLQAALRQVATLVARAVPSSEVFTAVAEELARYLGVPHAALLRYEPDGTAVVLAARDEDGKEDARRHEVFFPGRERGGHGVPHRPRGPDRQPRRGWRARRQIHQRTGYSLGGRGRRSWWTAGCGVRPWWAR